MTFPSLTDGSTNGGTAAGTTVTIGLGYTATAGRTSVVFVAMNDAAQAGATVSGWTNVGGGVSRTGASLNIFAKIAAGGETSIVVPTTSGDHWASTNYQMTGGNTTMSNYKVAFNSASADPPSLTPGFGAADYLWFAICTDQTTVPSASPTGYTGIGGTSTPDTGQGGSSPTVVVTSSKQAVNAASQDPSTYSAGATALMSATFAVPPTVLPFTPLPRRLVLNQAVKRASYY